MVKFTARPPMSAFGTDEARRMAMSQRTHVIGSEAVAASRRIAVPMCCAVPSAPADPAGTTSITPP
jgi:hypothetical protein